MTLIEALIYAFLLSFLLAGFISFASQAHEEDATLSGQILDAQNE